MDVNERPIGISEDGEEVYPDGATRGWECPGGNYDWRRADPVFVAADGTSYYARPLPLFEQFVEVAAAAWNRRNKGL